MRRSTGKDAAGYCWKGDRPKKDDINQKLFYEQYFEVQHESVKLVIDKGTLKENGVRKDIQKNYDRVKSGEVTIKELCSENAMFVHQYQRILELGVQHREEELFRLGKMTTCEWITGKPGVGKSHYAFYTAFEKYGGYDPKTCYDWNLEEEFQTYSGQKVVIINEYKCPKKLRFGVLLKMIDNKLKFFATEVLC